MLDIVTQRAEATVRDAKKPCRECREAGCALALGVEPLDTCKNLGCGMWPYARHSEIVREYPSERR